MLEGAEFAPQALAKPQEQSLGEPSGTATPNSTLSRVLRKVMELMKLSDLVFFSQYFWTFFVKINI